MTKAMTAVTAALKASRVHVCVCESVALLILFFLLIDSVMTRSLWT